MRTHLFNVLLASSVAIVFVVAGCGEQPKAIPPKKLPKSKGRFGAQLMHSDFSLPAPSPDLMASSRVRPPALSFNEQQNVAWRAPLFGDGSSRPLTQRQQVFLTAVSPLVENANADSSMQESLLHLFCFERATGAPQWRRDIVAQTPMPTCSSPVTDGNLIFAAFGASGVFAFDFAGALRWEASLGTIEESGDRGQVAQQRSLGQPATPIALHKNLLIVNASKLDHAIVALEKSTGTLAWTISGVGESSCAPVFAQLSDGSTEMLLFTEGFLKGLDPETGKEIWRCAGFANNGSAQPFVSNDVCYCTGADGELTAIKLGGRGDVSSTHRLWSVDGKSKSATPHLLNGFLYLMADDGHWQCFEARSGKRIAKVKTASNVPLVSEPLLLNSHFYLSTADAGVLIYEANSQLNEVSQNQVTPQPDTAPSLAVSVNRLFLRTDAALYAIEDLEQSDDEATPEAASTAQVSNEQTIVETDPGEPIVPTQR